MWPGVGVGVGVGVAVAGVKLNNNTATDNTKRTKILEFETRRIFAKHYENEEQITEKLAKLWLECDSTTTQQARNKANGGIKDVKTCRIFAKNYENEELFTLKWRNTAVGVDLNNKTGSTNPERNQQQGRKIRGPS